MAKKKEEEEEVLFVGVPNPNDVRRDILTSSKDIINSLQRYEEIKDIKKEKALLGVELGRTMKELGVLNRKLKRVIPKTEAKLKPKKISREEAMEDVDGEVTEERVASEKSKLNVLEDELSKIEEKLARLE